MKNILQTLLLVLIFGCTTQTNSRDKNESSSGDDKDPSTDVVTKYRSGDADPVLDGYPVPITGMNFTFAKLGVVEGKNAVFAYTENPYVANAQVQSFAPGVTVTFDVSAIKNVCGSVTSVAQDKNNNRQTTAIRIEGCRISDIRKSGFISLKIGNHQPVYFPPRQDSGKATMFFGLTESTDAANMDGQHQVRIMRIEHQANQVLAKNVATQSLRSQSSSPQIWANAGDLQVSGDQIIVAASEMIDSGLFLGKVAQSATDASIALAKIDGDRAAAVFLEMGASGPYILRSISNATGGVTSVDMVAHNFATGQTNKATVASYPGADVVIAQGIFMANGNPAGSLRDWNATSSNRPPFANVLANGTGAPQNLDSELAGRQSASIVCGNTSPSPGVSDFRNNVSFVTDGNGVVHQLFLCGDSFNAGRFWVKDAPLYYPNQTNLLIDRTKLEQFGQVSGDEQYPYNLKASLAPDGGQICVAYAIISNFAHAKKFSIRCSQANALAPSSIFEAEILLTDLPGSNIEMSSEFAMAAENQGVNIVVHSRVSANEGQLFHVFIDSAGTKKVTAIGNTFSPGGVHPAFFKRSVVVGQ